jgi:hypothetical protein
VRILRKTRVILMHTAQVDVSIGSGKYLWVSGLLILSYSMLSALNVDLLFLSLFKYISGNCVN